MQTDFFRKLWRTITGEAGRELRRRSRFEHSRMRFDDSTVEIEVKELPPWRSRVRWDEITAVGVEADGLLGPGLNLFITREPNVVWAPLEGDGGPALHEELRRRGVPFRPLPELWRELDERLKEQARTLMRRDFPPEDWPEVQAALDTYRGDLVGRTHVAIVRLAGGNLGKLRELAAEARRGRGDVVSRDIIENM